MRQNPICQKCVRLIVCKVRICVSNPVVWKIKIVVFALKEMLIVIMIVIFMSIGQKVMIKNVAILTEVTNAICHVTVSLPIVVAILLAVVQCWKNELAWRFAIKNRLYSYILHSMTGRSIIYESRERVGWAEDPNLRISRY